MNSKAASALSFALSTASAFSFHGINVWALQKDQRRCRRSYASMHMQTEDDPSLIYLPPFYFHHTSDKQEDYLTETFIIYFSNAGKKFLFTCNNFHKQTCLIKGINLMVLLITGVSMCNKSMQSSSK
jgi:hypothetical protein